MRSFKCSNTFPCDSCHRLDAECVFAVDQDGRRKETRKRKVEDLQNDSDFLNELLDALRQTKDQQVGQIVALIRSGAAIGEIKTFIGQKGLEDGIASGSEENPDLLLLRQQIDRHEEEMVRTADPTEDSQEKRTRKGLHIADLIDRPPFPISASPWTTVI